MVRVDFPRRRCINQIGAKLCNPVGHTLCQLIAVAQTPVRKTPEFRRAVAQNLRCCHALALAHVGLSIKRAVGQYQHADRVSVLDVLDNRTTTTKHLIVRMRCQHQHRAGWQAQAGTVGDEIGFQGRQ